jgi:hypothetical protein
MDHRTGAWYAAHRRRGWLPHVGLPTRNVARQLDDAKTQLTEEQNRAAELQSKFAETEDELKRAVEGLRRERELREKFEEMVSEGKK